MDVACSGKSGKSRVVMAQYGLSTLGNVALGEGLLAA